MLDLTAQQTHLYRVEVHAVEPHGVGLESLALEAKLGVNGNRRLIVFACLKLDASESLAPSLLDAGREQACPESVRVFLAILVIGMQLANLWR